MTATTGSKAAELRTHSAPLVEELRAAALAFSDDPDSAADVLERMASDVERAMDQPIALFPVIHHSPASGVQMLRYLATTKPKLVFVEMCEDMLPLAKELGDCELPVALQAFASQPVGYPESWAPLSLVAPLFRVMIRFR